MNAKLEKNTKDLGEKPIGRLLLSFSLPAVVGLLVNVLYNIVDRIFVGQTVGRMGIAGISIGAPLIMFIAAFVMLIGVGGNALFSIRLGQRKVSEAQNIMGNSLSLLIIMGIIITVGGLFFADNILGFLGTSQDTMPYAKEYWGIILGGGLFQVIAMGLNNFIRSSGHPKKAMFTMIIGALTNIVLDYIFVIKMGWGLRGAAIATIISQAVSCAFVLAHFYGAGEHIKPALHDLRLKLSVVTEIIKMGSSAFFIHMSLSIANFTINHSLIKYGGDIAISANGIINSITQLTFMPVFGINQGLQPIAGYNYGAKKYDRVLKTYYTALTASLIIMGTITALMFIFAAYLVRAFNNEDLELIKLATRALRLSNIFLLFFCVASVSSTLFLAIGKPLKSTFLAVARILVVLVPLILIIPLFFGLDGVWYALTLSDFGGGVIAYLMIKKEIKKLKSKTFATI